MPNRHETLGSLFDDIADSIRAKTGSSETIVADNFDIAIDNLSTNPETCSTVAELEAKMITGNEGKIYKYTGSTSGRYINGDIYEVEFTPLPKVGGRIFYIDETATGATYTFYDNNMNVLPTQTVEGLANAYYYEVSGTPSKDKFYVSEQQSVVSGNTGGASGVVRKYDGTNYCMWATENGQTFDSTKIDIFDIAGTTVGTGRRNTQHIFSDWNTAVFFPAHNSVSGKVTCWDFCKTCNDNSVNGCNDWFVPSIAELKYLRESGIWGSSNVDWIATTKYGTNSYSYLWSSSVYSDNNFSWDWIVVSSDSNAGYLTHNYQFIGLFLALVRAF